MLRSVSGSRSDSGSAVSGAGSVVFLLRFVLRLVAASAGVIDPLVVVAVRG